MSDRIFNCKICEQKVFECYLDGNLKVCEESIEGLIIGHTCQVWFLDA